MEHAHEILITVLAFLDRKSSLRQDIKEPPEVGRDRQAFE